MRTFFTLTYTIMFLTSTLCAAPKPKPKAPVPHSTPKTTERPVANTERTINEAAPTKDIIPESPSVKARIAEIEARKRRAPDVQQSDIPSTGTPLVADFLPEREAFKPQTNVSEAPVRVVPETPAVIDTHKNPVIETSGVIVSRLYDPTPATKKALLDPLVAKQQLVPERGDITAAPFTPRTTALAVVHPETKIVVQQAAPNAKTILEHLAQTTQEKESAYKTLNNTIATLQRESKSPTKEQFASLDKATQDLRQARLAERQQNIVLKQQAVNAIQEKIKQSDGAELQKIHQEYIDTNSKMKSTPTTDTETIGNLAASLRELTTKDLIGQENLARANLLGAKQELYRGEIGSLTNMFVNKRSTNPQKRQAAVDLVNYMEKAKSEKVLDIFDRAQMVNSPEIKKMVELSLKINDKHVARELLAANQLNTLLDTYNQASPAERKKLQKSLQAFVTNNLKSGALSTTNFSELIQRKKINNPAVSLPSLSLEAPAPSMMSRLKNSLSNLGSKLKNAVTTQSTKVSPQAAPARATLQRSNAQQKLQLTD